MKKVVKKKTKVNPRKVAEERKTRLSQLSEEIEKEGVLNTTPVDMGGMLNINSDYLTLPQDMTEIPSHELGNFLNAFTQQRMYMRTLIGWQQLVVEGAKRNYYDKFSPLYEELSKNKMSETAKELMINNDPMVKEHYLNYRDEREKLSLLGYSIDNLEDAIFLISREISRRGSDFNYDTRTSSVDKR